MADLGNVTKITLPNGDVAHLKDGNAMPISGGTFTGPVTFGDSMTAPDANVGDLVVTGSASFTNNAQFNTINGVSVGNSPKFTDTTYTFANGTNGFTVTPSGGSAQTVTVTPSITNNITGSGTTNKIPKFTGANTIGDGYGVTDNSAATAVTSSDTNLITGRTLYYAGYTKNTGTVTQVTAGTGLSIGSTAGGNFTTSGTINHTNSVTAQTTQAVYPIKIDAQGHISAYGSAQTILTLGTGASNAAAGNHTHTTTLASGGTATVTLSANTAYTLTAGGTSVIFKTPADSNNYVNQSASTTDSWRKVLLHYTADAASTTAVSNSTNVVYGAVGVSVQPSSGTLRATKYNVADNVELQYNSTTKALDFVFL